MIVCASHGQLPWSDNTACGHDPKYGPGGAMSHRTSSGQRVNTKNRDGFGFTNGGGRGRGKDGAPKEPRAIASGGKPNPSMTRRRAGSGEVEVQSYKPPKKANPGNLIKLAVGGGLMGSKLAHENEAPFPLALAERFVRSFCPPNGIVYDGFAGSGTTLHAALKHGRRCIVVDVRQSQCDLMERRAAEAIEELQRKEVAA